MIDKPRKIALNILYDIEQKNSYSNITLNKAINENKKDLSKIDIAFISEIVYGVTYWKLTLDEIIKKYSKIKLKKISPWILNILRMGAYQIIFLTKVPKSAAVNESVNLAKRYGHTASSNFVNAILRKIEKEDYEELFKIKDEKLKISKTTSTPIWIIEELLKTKNIKEVEKICTAFTNKPNITIRINNLKISNNKFKEELEKRNIKYQEFINQENSKNVNTKTANDKNSEITNSKMANVKITNSEIANKTTETKGNNNSLEINQIKKPDNTLDKFLELPNLSNIENIDLFKQGFFTIQDISAGFTVVLLSPKSEEIILDACAAPGGKTTFIAEMMENKGKIIALDIYKHRLKLIEENAKRLGINIIETKEQDVTKFNENFVEKFDKILLDVPCMGIGVIKRKPDIKWQRKASDLEEITKIQYNILENCKKYLKVGGDILYSTCSIFSCENEDIINKFLNNNKNFKIENKELPRMEFFKNFKTEEGYYKINPTDKNDGFFMCKLTKINN